MKQKIAEKLKQRKRKIRARLDKKSMPDEPRPMFNPGNIQYELSDRNHGILYGGIGVMQKLVKRLKLDDVINNHLHLFKIHNPYFESDHVLNIAYDILCNGECLEDIERLRNDEVMASLAWNLKAWYALSLPSFISPDWGNKECKLS